MEEKPTTNFIERGSKKRRVFLNYAEDFRKFCRERPGVAKKILVMMDKVENTGEPALEDGDVKVGYLSMGYPERSFKFHIEIDGQKFFVKKVKREKVALAAKDETMASLEAKKILENIPWVEIEEIKLAYEDRKYSFFVAKWYDLVSVKEYLMNSIDSTKKAVLEERVIELESRLQHFHDISPRNMFYDPKKDKIILFDLHTDQERFP